MISYSHRRKQRPRFQIFFSNDGFIILDLHRQQDQLRQLSKRTGETSEGPGEEARRQQHPSPSKNVEPPQRPKQHLRRDTPRRSVDVPRAINVPGSRQSAEETGRCDRHRLDLAPDVSEVGVVRRGQMSL
ncbi:hypothetical protein TKK_0000394 [Trichogramma kaykai]